MVGPGGAGAAVAKAASDRSPEGTEALSTAGVRSMDTPWGLDDRRDPDFGTSKPPAIDMVGPGGAGAAVAKVASDRSPAGAEALSTANVRSVDTPWGLDDRRDPDSGTSKPPAIDMVGPGGAGAAVAKVASDRSPAGTEALSTANVRSVDTPWGLDDRRDPDSGTSKPPAVGMVGPGGAGAAVAKVASDRSPAGAEALSTANVRSVDTPWGLDDRRDPDSGTSKPPAIDMVGPGGAGAAVAKVASDRSPAGTEALSTANVRSVDTPWGLDDRRDPDSGTSKPPAVGMVGPGGAGAAVAKVASDRSPAGAEALSTANVRSVDTPWGLDDRRDPDSGTSKPPAIDMVGPGGAGAAVAKVASDRSPAGTEALSTANVRSVDTPWGLDDRRDPDSGTSKPPAVGMVGPGGAGAAVAKVASDRSPAGTEALSTANVRSVDTPWGLDDRRDPDSGTSKPPAIDMVGPGGAGAAVAKVASDRSPAGTEALSTANVRSVDTPRGLDDRRDPDSGTSKPPAVDMVGPGGAGAAVAKVASDRSPAGTEALSTANVRSVDTPWGLDGRCDPDSGTSKPPAKYMVGPGGAGAAVAKVASDRSPAGTEALSTANVRSVDTPWGLDDRRDPDSGTSKPPAVDMVGPGGVGAAVAKVKKKKKKKKNKQCYHCFFIDRLCRSLSIFRPGQDAKLIVFSLKIIKRI